MNIAQNVNRIRERIEQAAVRAGRDPRSVELVAATKNVSVERIREAISAGVKVIAENRVQEFLQKADQLKSEAEWHFIGHLQTNKVRLLGDRVSLIHSLDRISLARELDKQGAARGSDYRVLLEVNLGGEASKFGLSESEVRPFLRDISGYSHIRIVGLMTVAPYAVNPEEIRPVFRRLRALAESLSGEDWPGVVMEHLSMGMTNDFEVAVEEGATMVRIGTAIFGERPAPGLG